MKEHGLKVLVLGACGFLGKQVIAECQRQGIEFAGVCRCNGFDLRGEAVVRGLLSETMPKALVNCACHSGSVHYVNERPASVLCDNVRLLEALYRAAGAMENSPVIVNPVANCAYPGRSGVLREEEIEDGPVHKSVLGVGASRRLLLSLSCSYERELGLRSRNWLIPNAYGPGDHLDPRKTHALNGLILRMVFAQVQGTTDFVVWGSGQPLREWVFVEDVAWILVDSACREVPGETWPLNIAQRESHSIAEIAKVVAEALGYEGRILFDMRGPDGAPMKEMDDHNFRKAYPKYVFMPLRDGIQRTIEHYRGRLQSLSAREFDELACAIGE